MSNSNSFANNNSFNSIDAEFGLTTALAQVSSGDANHNNTDKTMNNQTEINMNELTSEKALNALSVVNNNNKVPAIQSPIEVLAEATIADGWVALSDEERKLLSETNQLGFREVKTSFKAWELLTSSNLGIVKGSFAGKVETLYSKGLPGVNALEAIYGKHCFDEGSEAFANQIVDGVFHTIHKQGNLVVEIAVDFNKGKLCYVAKHSKLGNVSVEPTVKDLRKFALINFFSGNQKANVRGLYSVENTVRLFIELVRTCWTVNHFNFLVAGMTSKLFIDTTEQQFRRSGRGYGVREFSTDLDELSREQIIEAHKISIIPTACMIQKPGVIFAKTTVDAKLDGSEFKTCFNFFNKFNEPVIIDKQAKKWLAYGDGARASFVDYDGTSLVSANPTDKTAKFLNRISSHSFKQASNQRATFKGMDDVSGQYVRSNLQIALKNDKTCFVEGIDLPAFVSFGDFALNAGTIETNVLKDVKFSYDLAKTLNNEVSLADFEASFLLDEDGERLANSAIKLKVQEAVIAQLNEMGSIIAPGEAIKVAGASVARNTKHFAIDTSKLTTNKSEVIVSLAGTTANGKASTINVAVKGSAHMLGKRSPKLRSNLKKGTAFPTGTVVKRDDVVQDWTTILSSETVKGSAGMAELIANHDKYNSVDVVWNKGELLIDGVAVDVKSILEGLCDSYQIVRRFNKEVLENPVFAPIVERARYINSLNIIEEGDDLVITETVRGFFSYSNYCVEVSSADENAGYSALGTNEQHFVALFNSLISSNLLNWSQANLAKAQYLTVDYNEAVEINIEDREAIKALAEMIKNASGSKHDMERLAKAFPTGVKISGCGFHQVIPFGALLHFGNWSGIFPASSNIEVGSFTEEDEDKDISRNICQEVFDVIRFLADDSLVGYDASASVIVFDQMVRDEITKLNGMQGWLTTLRSNRASKLVKVGETVGKKRRGKQFNYHLKVVGDQGLGFDAETKLPVVEVNPNNPGGFRDGSRVLLSRCPLPLFTACVVRHNEALDSAVVAVNPLVWSASNAGDNDGDLAYLTNLFVLNGNKEVSADECLAYNQKYSGLATHWDVFAEAEGQARPLSPMLDNLGKGEDTLVKFCEMGAVITSKLANAIPLVAQHYAIGVGSFHQVATATTEAIGNKAFASGVAPSKDEVIALHQSWMDYEEFGLGGWTENNAQVLQELKTNITSEMFNPGCFKPRKRRGKSTTVSSVNWLAIEASAISKIGAKVLNNEAGASDENIIAQALKRIAKKDIANGEVHLWLQVSRIVRTNPNALDGYRFGKHIEVLGRVRALAHLG